MNSSEIAGTVFILISYLMIIKIIIKNPEGISFSSFVLWAILDCITAIMIFLKDGSWFLPALFTFLSIFVSIILWLKNERTWSKNDINISILILICIIFWFFTGETEGTIAATIAVILAGLSQLKMTIEKPKRETLYSWTIFTFGNFFFYMASDATLYEEFVKERLCPFGNGLMSLIITTVILLKK